MIYHSPLEVPVVGPPYLLLCAEHDLLCRIQGDVREWMNKNTKVETYWLFE